MFTRIVSKAFFYDGAHGKHPENLDVDASVATDTLIKRLFIEWKPRRVMETHGLWLLIHRFQNILRELIKRQFSIWNIFFCFLFSLISFLSQFS